MVRTRLLTRSRNTALFGALLAFALVFAQTGAMVHACNHLRVSGEQLSAPGTTSPVCADCLSFAPLLAAAAGHSHSLAITAPLASAYRAPVAPLVALSPRHAFLPRGPPPSA